MIYSCLVVKALLAYYNTISFISFLNAGVAQSVEQLICNQSVGGSSPLGGSFKLNYFYWIESQAGCDFGEMAERSMAADCKSAGVRLRRFESFSPHHLRV